jgi:hypothetical protein
VSSASALTTTLAKNRNLAINELRRITADQSLSLAKRQAAAEATEALEAWMFERAVTGAGGVAKSVGPKLAAAGVTFLKVS